jgi:LacI family transcriptional regulator
MGRRIGIKDVAAAAGVSATTVSHILNEVEGKRINPETRQRVLETARELGYAPNGLARGLRLKRSNTIGFVSDQIATTPHAGRIILGAQEEAAKHDLLLLMMNTGGHGQNDTSRHESFPTRISWIGPAPQAAPLHQYWPRRGHRI